MGSFINFLLLAVIFEGFLGACSAPVSSPGSKTSSKDETEDTDNVFAGRIELDWGLSNFTQSGSFATGVYNYTEMVVDGYRGLFCFENNNPCQRAATEIRSEIGNNPVVIQAFELNMSEPQGTTVQLLAASVTTAEIQFNGASGGLNFLNVHTRELVAGQTCNLTDSNAVGLAAGARGVERVVTGLYLYDEGILNVSGSEFNLAYLTSGRIYYSGLKPTVSSEEGLPFAFTFVPTVQAAQVDFGRQGFTTQVSGASGGLKVSPKFGLDEAYALDANIQNWENHVVLGFCIQGTKTNSVGTRPLFLGAKTRSYRPILKLRQ